jgi:hypothetical protein
MTTASCLIFMTLKDILQYVILTFIPKAYFEKKFSTCNIVGICNGLTLPEMTTAQFIIHLWGKGYKYVHKWQCVKNRNSIYNFCRKFFFLNSDQKLRKLLKTWSTLVIFKIHISGLQIHISISSYINTGRSHFTQFLFAWCGLNITWKFFKQI